MSKRYLKPLILTSVFALSASAQAMLEHAASAASGSSAGVAGKQISDGITAIMGKSSSNHESDVEPQAPVAKRAPGGEHPPGWKQAEADRPPARTATIAVTTQQSVTTGTIRRNPTPVQIEAAPRTQPITAAYALSRWQPMGMISPVATAQTIAQIAPGTSIEELGNKLGVPAARVIIPGNEGQLLQLIRYRDSAGIVGVVHVVDGQVARVDVK